MTGLREVSESEVMRLALLDCALLVRDLQSSIRSAISAIDRKSFETARRELLHALDEMAVAQRRRER